MHSLTLEEARRAVAGALFDFAAYLTTLPDYESFPVGAKHPTPPMMDALKKWAEKRGNTASWLDHADVQDWNHILLSTELLGPQVERLAKTILRLYPERIVGEGACDIAVELIKELHAHDVKEKK